MRLLAASRGRPGIATVVLNEASIANPGSQTPMGPAPRVTTRQGKISVEVNAPNHMPSNSPSRRVGVSPFAVAEPPQPPHACFQPPMRDIVMVNTVGGRSARLVTIDP